MPDLFDWADHAPHPGDRGGMTYEHEEDYVRLNKQATDVWRAMADMKWHTLAGLSGLTGHPEASVSARLRDFRKSKFGGHDVERARIAGGLFAYRLHPNPRALVLEDEQEEFSF